MGKQGRRKPTAAETLVAEAILRAEERLSAEGIDMGVLTHNEMTELFEDLTRWVSEQPWAQVARGKIDVEIDLSKPGPAIVEDILRASFEKKIDGPVAQHLVGAKLARRFPSKTIENYSATAADAQLKREADFLVEDAAFQVSVAPTSDHLQKCADNLMQGRQPYMIVPAAQVGKARAFAEDKNIEREVAIVAIESFVGQNIDELGEFDRNKVKPEMAAVLKEYNRRVAEVETDQSIQINIPKHLDEV
jgi:Domain of unknown function (DUF4928)